MARDKGGQILSVHYDKVWNMMLNEFLKEHRKVAILQSGVAELTARFKAADSRIEKVSEQLELSKSAPQTALNNQ